MRVFGILGCLALAAPLVAYGYVGLFSRYAADDYCTAGQLASRGLLGMQVSFYQGWSGRVSFTLVAGLVESVGISLVPALPALLAAVLPGVIGLVAPGAGGMVGVSRHDSRRGAQALAVLVCGTLVTLALCFVPSYYALSSPAPGRARVIPQFVLVAATATARYVVGRYLRDRLRAPYRMPTLVASATIAAVLVGVAPLLLVPAAFAEVPDARLYASEWDGIDAQIRSARARGVEDVEVAPLTATGTIRDMDFLAPDPSNWLNQCAARYYGVRSIAARETRPA